MKSVLSTQNPCIFRCDKGEITFSCLSHPSASNPDEYYSKVRQDWAELRADKNGGRVAAS